MIWILINGGPFHCKMGKDVSLLLCRCIAIFMICCILTTVIGSILITLSSVFASCETPIEICSWEISNGKCIYLVGGKECEGSICDDSLNNTFPCYKKDSVDRNCRYGLECRKRPSLGLFFPGMIIFFLPCTVCAALIVGIALVAGGILRIYR